MKTEDKPEGIPPVRIGDIIRIIPNGRAKEDLFVNYHGFIIFIKRVPLGQEEEIMSIKVLAVKNKYAFAEYREER